MRTRSRGATSRAKRSAQRRCTSRGVPGTTVCGMMWLKPASTNHWTRSATVSGRADQLALRPRDDALGIGQDLPALERRGPGLVALHARHVDREGVVVVDLGLHVARHVDLRLGDGLLVRLGHDGVHEQRSQRRDGLERADLGRALLPGGEQLHGLDAERRAHRRQTELGHHGRRRERADRAEEVDPLAHRRRAHPHRRVDGEVHAAVRERLAAHREVEDLPDLA